MDVNVEPVKTPPRVQREMAFRVGSTPIAARKDHHGAHVAHEHDFLEIAFVLEGQGVCFSMYGDLPAAPGSVFVVHPGVWHGYRTDDRFSVYYCCIGTVLIQREFAFLRDDPRLQYLLQGGQASGKQRGLIDLKLPPESMARCAGLLDSLARSGDMNFDGTRADQAGHLILLLGELSRNLGPEHEEIARDTPPPHPAAVKAIQLLRDHLAHAWTLDELAGSVHMDTSYLIKVFKAATGFSPMAYLNHARVERAAGLLVNSDAPISQIGSIVGWDDANYFARRFKAQVGMSASDYRQHHTKTPPFRG